MIQDIQVIQSMIDTMVGIPKFSYPARQNQAPKPTDEFAHVRLLEEYQVGIPALEVVSQTAEETVHHIRSVARLRFRIGVVDTDGLPSALIMHGWTSEAMKALMIESGYGFIRCFPLSNEDAKLEREWEYRVGLSVEFYVERLLVQTNVNNITALSVSGAYYDISNTDEYLMNFDLNP